MKEKNRYFLIQKESESDKQNRKNLSAISEKYLYKDSKKAKEVIAQFNRLSYSKKLEFVEVSFDCSVSTYSWKLSNENSAKNLSNIISILPQNDDEALYYIEWKAKKEITALKDNFSKIIDTKRHQSEKLQILQHEQKTLERSTPDNFILGYRCRLLNESQNEWQKMFDSQIKKYNVEDFISGMVHYEYEHYLKGKD